MNHEQLVKDSGLDVTGDLLSAGSLVRTKTNKFNQTNYDMGFEDIPPYHLTPHGINLKFIRDIGTFDFENRDKATATLLRLSRAQILRPLIFSSFESILDVAINTSVTTRGWDCSTSATSATITAGVGGILLSTGATSGEKTTVKASSASVLDFSKHPDFSAIAKFNSTASVTAFLGMGDYDGGAGKKYVGFLLSSGALNIAINDGVTATTVAVSGYTLTNFNSFAAIVTAVSASSTKRIDFFVNGTLVYTKTEVAATPVLPTGTEAYFLQFVITNSTTADKTMTLANATFGQGL